MKSNGWSEGTTALQLFAHLGGEALNVALLMPKREREKWEDLSNGLSAYYNYPGRLAVFRWRFENAFPRPGIDATFANAFRRPGIDATFATELESLQCGDLGTWASVPMKQ